MQAQIFFCDEPTSGATGLFLPDAHDLDLQAAV